MPVLWLLAGFGVCGSLDDLLASDNLPDVVEEERLDSLFDAFLAVLSLQLPVELVWSIFCARHAVILSSSIASNIYFYIAALK
jgi:hypothetical protein